MRIVDSHKQKYFVLIIDLSESSKVFVNALIGYYKNFRSEFSWVLIDTFLRALVVKFRILLQEFQEREKKEGLLCITSVCHCFELRISSFL